MSTPKTGGKTCENSVGLRIPCGALALNGELMIPLDAKGVVVFAHGSGSSRTSPRNQIAAKTMRKLGKGTLLFDLLTAEEELDDTLKRRVSLDIPLLAERFLQVTQWLVARPGARRLGIVYFSSSTGAAAALAAAAELGQQVRAVVSRGGRPDLATKTLSRVKSPTLLIVGGYDYHVLELNRKAFAQLKCEKQLRIVPGAGHLFQEIGTLETATSLAADWLHRYLS